MFHASGKILKDFFNNVDDTVLAKFFFVQYCSILDQYLQIPHRPLNKVSKEHQAL